MPKHKIEIDVDIPDGYELVAYREAETGEEYVYAGTVVQRRDAVRSLGKYFIVRKSKPSFQWPAWLKAAAIAKDTSGAIIAHKSKPAFLGGTWSGCGHYATLNRIGIYDIDLSWFDGVEAKDSLVLNPNLKASKHG